MIIRRTPSLTALILIALAALVACGGGSEKAAEHYVAGTVFAAAGHWRNAITEFDESIRLDPGEADAHVNRRAPSYVASQISTVSSPQHGGVYSYQTSLPRKLGMPVSQTKDAGPSFVAHRLSNGTDTIVSGDRTLAF